MPYDFTYVESKEQNKQNRNRLIHTENKLMIARRRGAGGLDEKGERIKMYKLAVTRQSCGI